MAQVYAGTSGWAYPGWKPAFYPAKLAAAKFLGHYAGRLNSVEVNFTFRRFPNAKLETAWIAATPPGFQFGLKAHQTITHRKRLQEAAEFTSDFLRALDPLREVGKLGPVLFQLPPFLKCDVPRLTDFLAGLPRTTRLAFEFRHASWFTEAVYDVLRSANAALCLAESETLQTPEVLTADFTYLRLRKKTYAMEELLPRVMPLAERGDIYVYFKHEETPEGVLCAEQLLGAVTGHHRAAADSTSENTAGS